MRVVLVVGLLVINLIVFLWQTMRIEPPVAEVPAPLPPDKPLVLVSERPQQAVARDSGAQLRERLQCFRLGPFIKRALAENSVSDMTRFARRAEMDIQRQPVTLYWVFLPPLEDQKTAVKMAAELRKKGVRDLQVLTDKDRQNGISLGLYRFNEMAERRLKQIRKMGYDAELEQMARYRRRYWIRFEVGRDFPPDPQVWENWLRARGEGVSLDPVPCPTQED